MLTNLIKLLKGEYFDAEWKGKQGEKLTEVELNKLRLLGHRGRVLRNVYVPKDNGETTEVDVVFITKKGVFVIESKNYSGWIFGNEKDYVWTATLSKTNKNSFYNPVKQNENHVKWLKHYLNDKIPMFSLIVFSKRCELKKIAVESENVHVIKREQVFKTIDKIWDNTDDILCESTMESIYKLLKALTNVDEATRLAHIKNINDKVGNKSKSKEMKILINENHSKDNIMDENSEIEVSEENQSQSSTLICPRCKGELVLRVAKKGENKGNTFYGCSSYPKCRYIQNIEE